MIKKFKKYQNLKYYQLKGYLEGHIFAYGRIGGGKSVSLLSVIQGYHDNFGYKIFDLHGGDRNEQVYWAIPSQDAEYWNKKVAMLGRFDEKAPKQYKINFLYPCFSQKLPKKLPKKVVNGQIIVNSKVFTIPLKSITVADISTVIGIVSESNRYYWNEVLQKSFKQDNAGSLIHLSSKIKGLAGTTLMKNFILPLSRNNFIMDSYCEKNIDLINESRDTETISILCLDFVPKIFHAFIINWIARRLTEELDANKVPKKNILFMREVANFFKATDDSVLDDRLKIFRSNMADYIRMGRRGMYFALDCQSASETKGLVQGSEDYLLMFRTTSWRDKEEMCAELKRERRMLPAQVADLAFLDKGQAYIAETGRNVIKVQITLPRTAYWKKTYGNFYRNVWENYGGEWTNTEETLDYIEDKCEEALNYRISKEPKPKPKPENKLGKNESQLSKKDGMSESEHPPVDKSPEPVVQKEIIKKEKELPVRPLLRI